jgi:hypothetical protein
MTAECYYTHGYWKGKKEILIQWKSTGIFMNTARTLLICLALLQLGSGVAVPQSAPEEKEVVPFACQATDFNMQAWKVDRAVVLQDPAKEQTVLFDTTEGGAIVSLVYRGVEHVWGHNGGALLQMAFHNMRRFGTRTGDYNPTQAGDGLAFSPVTGIACQGTEAVTIMTMMLDFDNNNALLQDALLAVWGGRISELNPPSYFSPYTLETRAHWVPNPSGEPKYYLQLDQRFTHLAEEKIGLFAYDFALYVPWELKVHTASPENCPCPSSRARYIASGWYREADHQVGIAVAMRGADFPSGQLSVGFAADGKWRNRNLHLSTGEALDGIAQKSFIWYVMVGPWGNAVEFVRNLRK